MIKSKNIKIVLTIFIMATLLFSCSSNTKSKEKKYYVSLQGNDTNEGSLNAPFRTIKKGASVLTAGDTLVIKPGNYGYEYGILISKNGTKDSPIKIMAEKKGTVHLNGLRKKGEVDGPDSLKDCGTGSAIIIGNVSYVEIDGLHISNYLVGLDIGIWDGEALKNEHPTNKMHNIIVKNCTFEQNGKDGIQTFRADSVHISDCIFISGFIMEEEDGETYPNAVQDYGCNFYGSTSSIVENCYFYGAANQALSFKEGDVDCIARRNIFEGALYTAIYLGQNKIADNNDENRNPSCKNLIAEYNIVRGTKGFRVKSPIRVDNCINAVVRDNYFEGFDKTGLTSGINIFDEAKGKIEIYNNIVAFSVDKKTSSGIDIAEKLAKETELVIYNNTFYNVAQDIYGKLRKNDIYEKNIIYKSKRSLKNDKKNFYGNPNFVDGEPKQLAISTSAIKPEFDLLYKKLTEQFVLSPNSQAIGFGATPKLNK